MGWTRTGTVTVTNGQKTVVGAGTKFIQEGRIGDGFRGPNGLVYEVTNIASDTGLSIEPAYEGPTAAGAVYFLAPIQGYVKDTADALREANRQIALIPNSKQDRNVNLSGLSAVTFTQNSYPIFNSDGSVMVETISDEARLFNQQADVPAMRSRLGLVKTTSNMDATVGRIPSVGDFGLGGPSSPYVANANLQKTEGRFSTYNTAGLPDGYTGAFLGVLVVTPYSNDWVVQELTIINSVPLTWRRVFFSGTTWSAWCRVPLQTQFGTYLPGANAQQALPAGEYITTATWTGSPYPGTDGTNQGYLKVTVWENGSVYALQEWAPIIPSYGPRMYRQLTASGFQPWIIKPDMSSALTEPSSLRGGLMSQAIVSGVAVYKFASGLIVMTGTFVGQSQECTPNVVSLITFDIPAGIVASSFSSAALSAIPLSVYDSYGVVHAQPLSDTRIQAGVRNGASQQAFVIKGTISGRWK